MRVRTMMRVTMIMNGPKPRTTLCASLRNLNARQSFHRSHFIWKFTGKKAADQKLGPHFVGACAVDMHFDISQEPLYTEIYKRPRLSPERGRTLCASLRSRNACQDFARATLHGNLKEKGARPE